MSANNFEASWSNIATLVHMTCRQAGMRIGYNPWGARPTKYGRAKNVQNSAPFRTTLDFNR